MTKFGFPYSGKEVALSFQHLFAMFGATVLVPLLTGLNPSSALLCAGLGTLLFHLLTKMKVPVFLGSSFAFMPGIMAITIDSGGKVIAENIPYAQTGIVVAGLIYCVLSLIIYYVGVEKIKKVLPPIVTGPVIVVIGICLAGTAINDASGKSSSLFYSATSAYDAVTNTMVTTVLHDYTWLGWLIAIAVIGIVIFGMVKAKGFFKLVPILFGIIGGYLICVIIDLCGLNIMDYSAVSSAWNNSWLHLFNVPFVTLDANGVQFLSLPKFDSKLAVDAIVAISPIALVSFMEHIGDITTNGMVCGKDFMKDPGLNRTVLGDGLATSLAGLLGGPANTTYSENTGVLATTKNYDPRLLRLTAIFAIVLAFIAPFGATLQTIPAPVKGGIEIILFGMISSIGIRSMIESKLNFTHSRNLVIVALILVLGIGINAVGGIKIGSLTISGLFVATVAGIIANLVLPVQLEDTKPEQITTEGEVR